MKKMLCVLGVLMMPVMGMTEGWTIGNGIVLADGFDAGIYWDFRDGSGTAGLLNIARRGPLGFSVGIGVRDPEIWGGTTRWQKLLAGIDLDASAALKWNLAPIRPAISVLGAFEPEALTNKGSFGVMVKVIKTDIPDVIGFLKSIFEIKKEE